MTTPTSQNVGSMEGHARSALEGTIMACEALFVRGLDGIQF